MRTSTHDAGNEMRKFTFGIRKRQRGRVRKFAVGLSASLRGPRPGPRPVRFVFEERARTATHCALSKCCLANLQITTTAWTGSHHVTPKLTKRAKRGVAAWLRSPKLARTCRRNFRVRKCGCSARCDLGLREHGQVALGASPFAIKCPVCHECPLIFISSQGFLRLRESDGWQIDTQNQKQLG